jgi:hypothetical protein
MQINLEDIGHLQQETGAAENDQRLRAIVAERQVQELKAELVALKDQAEKSEGDEANPQGPNPDTSGEPEQAVADVRTDERDTSPGEVGDNAYRR